MIGSSNGSPQVSQERASADDVPVTPALANDQFTNDEHHDALSSYPAMFVPAWYAVILGLLSPGAKTRTPISAIAKGSHGAWCICALTS